jgi:hypothetical protein
MGGGPVDDFLIPSWSPLFSYVSYHLFVVCFSLVFICSVGSVFCCWSSCVSCQVLTVDCHLSLSLVVVCSWLSALH